MRIDKSKEIDYIIYIISNINKTITYIIKKYQDLVQIKTKNTTKEKIKNILKDL